MRKNDFLYNPFLWIAGVLAVIYIVYLSASGNNVSCGVNGVTELRCINGYSFIISNNGSTRQVLDEFGKGARCK